MGSNKSQLIIHEYPIAILDCGVVSGPDRGLFIHKNNRTVDHHHRSGWGWAGFLLDRLHPDRYSGPYKRIADLAVPQPVLPWIEERNPAVRNRHCPGGNESK